MLLSAEHLSINFGSRQLLDDVNFYLNEGDKVGVIGINGTGKSTFLKVLSGVTEPDGGTISRNPNVQVSLLPQNPAMEESATVLEQVFLHFPAEFRELNEYEAKAMLNRLGITDFAQKVGTLSGGQRKRVALAAALIHPADVLILDEPTNHLDSEMVAWLEDWLRRFKGGLVMVTCWEVVAAGRYPYTNHFGKLSREDQRIVEDSMARVNALELREQRAEMAEASERKRQSILRVEREWIMRGCKARTTKSKERIQRYEALLNQEAPETDEAVQMAAASSRLGKKIIELRDVSKAFDGRPIVSRFSYNLLRGDRIGIVGRNGAGKSTLLHLMAGELAPDSGTVEVGATVKIGHFSQEGRELDLNQRVYDFIHDIADEVRTDEGTFSANQMMERFLFPGDLQSVPIGRLSGGERRRLYLLSVLMEAPNVLLLDEPTNDLDVTTLSILEDYLLGFPGPILAVSHDRFFLDKLAESIFEVRGDGEIHRFTGNWTDWQAKRRAEEAPSPKAEKPKPAAERPRERKLKFTFKEQREFETIDDDIAALEARIEKLDAEIMANATNSGKLNELTQEKTEAEAQLEEKMDRWVYLNDLAEQIEAQNNN